MSETQREWITPTAAPLQRSYGVVAISQKYQFFLKMGDGYVIAAKGRSCWRSQGSKSEPPPLTNWLIRLVAEFYGHCKTDGFDCMYSNNQSISFCNHKNIKMIQKVQSRNMLSTVNSKYYQIYGVFFFSGVEVILHYYFALKHRIHIEHVSNLCIYTMISTQHYSCTLTFVYLWNYGNEIFEGKSNVIKKSEEIKNT